MFSTFAQRFLDDRVLTCSTQTVKLYSHYLNYLGRWLGERPITKQTMGDFLRFQKERSIADDTLRNYYRFLKALCNFLHAEDLIADNPFVGRGKVKIAPPRRRRMETYSNRDIARLIAAANVESPNKRCPSNQRRRWSRNGPLQRELEQARALILLLCDSALRAGEVVRLNCADVRHEELVVISKGGHTDVAYITDTTRIALQQLAADRPNDEPLFRNWEGGRCTTASLRKIIKRAAERADVSLPPRPIHAFRHYAARQWVKRGVPDLVIKSLMRHAQLSTTQIYTQLDTEELGIIHAQASPIKELLQLAFGDTTGYER
jgi:site-specific recombinase XerD